MNIVLVTPEPPAETTGHAITAQRWTQLWRDLRHETDAIHAWGEADEDPDLMVALHPTETHAAIEAYVDAHPDRPLIVTPSGPELYGDRTDDPHLADAYERADIIVLFQERAVDALPQEVQSKARIITPSVGRLAVVDALREKWSEGPDASRSLPDELEEGAFNVVVAAHLRDGKDALLCAEAARKLDDDSEIHVTHVGRALDRSWEEKVRNAERRNPRYDWAGEVSRSEALRLIAAAALLCTTSRIEAGPNVVGEAIALGTPVIATEIPGHVGLLGADYPGFVPVGDAEALADALGRAEREGNFYRALAERGRERRDQFAPARERRTWRDLLDELA